MAISRSFILFFLVLCSWVLVGFCQGQGNTPPCVQQLLPCQPYLKADTPPASCCVPLKQLIADDKQCLCTVLNDPGIMQSLNITKADAVNLAKNCGANADLSASDLLMFSGSLPSPPPKSAASVRSFHVGTLYLSLLVAFLFFTKSTS